MDPFASPEPKKDEEPTVSQFPWSLAAPPGSPVPHDLPDMPGQQPASTTPSTSTFAQPTWSGNATPTTPVKPAKPSLIPIVAASLLAGLIGGVAGFTLADNGSVASGNNSSVTIPVINGNSSERPAGTIASIAAAVLPTVVNIDVSGSMGSGTGSGSVIQSDSKGSYILTNNHVIAGGVNGGTITVTFQDRTSTQARIVGRDPSYDLAVLRIDTPNLPTLPVGDSSDIVVGDQVVAIGSPLGLSGTVTSGIVSALNRPVTAGGSGDASYFSAIQTDAAINPGNSGGPLVNANGHMVGVNSAIATVSNSGESGSIGLGFAIPTAQAMRVVDEIIKTGKSTIPVIGVQLDSSYDGEGARVAGVENGGPAAGAGVRAGDIITKVDGVPVVDSTEAIVSIRSNAPGDEVSVTVQRNGKEQKFQIVLGSRPSLGN